MPKRKGVKWEMRVKPGSPWENGTIESFNGKLRDELLARKWFDTLLEAKVLIEHGRCHDSTERPHRSLRYVPPAPEALQPCMFSLAQLKRTYRAGLEATPTLT